MAIFNVTFDSVQDSVQSAQNVIYINDAPSAGDLMHVVLDCIPDAGTSIVLERQSSQTAGPSNYHFSLFFSPGQLAQPGAISPSPDSSGAWSTAVVDGPSGTTIYCLSLGALTLQPGDSCKLTLQKVGARSQSGPRSTHIHFAFNQNVADVQPKGLSHLPFLVQIEKVPQQGGASLSAPLAVGFDTTNMVLSDGSSKNALVLRIVNLSASDIHVDPAQGSFTVLFDADGDTSQRWALATPDQVNAFYVPGKLDSSGVDPSWPGYNAWDLQQVSSGWKFTPKDSDTGLKAGAGAGLEIPISNIVTGHTVGRALVRVQYQGLSGYDDGEFTVEVQKTPLLYTDGRVGVGTTTPAEPLQVYTASGKRGFSHTDGTVDLATYVSDTGGWLGTYSNHPLKFYTNNSQAQLTLTTDGNLGIGTASPSARLDVQGDVAISGKLGVQADVSLSGKLDVQGDVSTSGSVDFSATLGPKLNLYDPGYVIGIQSDTIYFRSNDNFGFYQGGTHSDTALDPGGGTMVMAIAGGKVGVGTASPARPLQVQTGSGQFGLSHTDGDVELATYVSDTGGWLGTYSNHPLNLYTNNSQAQVTLTTGGNLGVGTTSPTSRLHVSGDLRIDGNINVNGQPPMAIKFYSANYDYPQWPTGYSYSDWVACIVGFDGHANNSCNGIKVLPEVQNNEWIISCDVRGPSDTFWQVLVLFIRREFFGEVDYIVPG